MPFGNEEVVVTVLLGTLLTLFFALFIVFLFILFNNKNKLNLKEKEAAKKAFEKTLLQSQLEIKEQTLRHIAYELHDNLGQVASLIKIHLNTLKLDDPVNAAVKIHESKTLLRQLITDLKSIAVDLNSDRIAQAGLLSSLESEVERLNKTGRFEAILQKEGSPPLLDSNTTTILYRMMQEILNNAVKHSHATRITVALRASENLLTLVCSDNGEGFDLGAKIKNGGSGLTNLQNRARLIKATIGFQSSPEKGTTIAIQLPL